MLHFSWFTGYLWTIRLVVFIAYGPMFHGLMYIYYGHEPDYSIVSGFYGPGAVLPWLLTSVQNVLSYRKEEELDSAGFTAIFAYASVAAMDAILHIFRAMQPLLSAYT